jgi:hypothetical protein
MQVDHAEPKSKIQAEQVLWVFRCPQALSCEDVNIVVTKESPGAFNQFSFTFILNPCFMFYYDCALSL